jgi:hypothetical protein
MIDSMIVVAALAAAGQAAAPAPVVRQAVPVARLSIPDEIAPAVTPYLNCRLLSQGVRLGAPGDQRIPTPAQLGADCSAARREAARQGERLLKQQGRRSASHRRIFVEKVLAQVDDFVATSMSPPSAPESRPDAKD